MPACILEQLESRQFLSVTVPSTPDLDPASDSGKSNTDNITNVTTPTFRGASSNGASVTIFADGIAVGTGAVNASHYSIQTTPLSNGVHAITAQASDTVGNLSGMSSKLNVTIDTVAPTTTFAPISPNPRNTGITGFTANFSEQVKCPQQISISSLKRRHGSWQYRVSAYASR